MSKLPEGWKLGPLPKGTYNFGGVVLSRHISSLSHTIQGFEFADFSGNGGKLAGGEEFDGCDVLAYNNSIITPTGVAVAIAVAEDEK